MQNSKIWSKNWRNALELQETSGNLSGLYWPTLYNEWLKLYQSIIFLPNKFMLWHKIFAQGRNKFCLHWNQEFKRSYGQVCARLNFIEIEKDFEKLTFSINLQENSLWKSVFVMEAHLSKLRCVQEEDWFGRRLCIL